MGKNELLERTFNFGIDCIVFLRTLPNSQENYVIKNQLIRSSTSIGANYEESQAGSSKADFINKVKISLREARESNYWLRIIAKTNDISSKELKNLIRESNELKNILAAIIIKTQGNISKR